MHPCQHDAVKSGVLGPYPGKILRAEHTQEIEKGKEVAAGVYFVDQEDKFTFRLVDKFCNYIRKRIHVRYCAGRGFQKIRKPGLYKTERFLHLLHKHPGKRSVRFVPLLVYALEIHFDGQVALHFGQCFGEQNKIVVFPYCLGRLMMKYLPRSTMSRMLASLAL
ncbi:MAG: hypothetical protein J5I98_30950 [Phaeodactylibacter sp.]|nr:hypothetical protein [Phaeodactylibacter sp.]